MANDDITHAGDSGIDAHTVAEEEGIAGRRVDFGRARDATPVGLVALKELVAGLHEELAVIRPSLDITPAPPDVRLARLERKTVEMEWVVYGMLGLFLALFLLRR